MPERRLPTALALAAALLTALAGAPAAAPPEPTPALLRLQLPQQAGTLAYYASEPPPDAAASAPAVAPPAPETALLVFHGYPRDAGRSFTAGLAAVRAAGLQQRVLVIAPLFQVDAADAPHCRSPGEPAAQPGDALWRCGGWPAGELSSGPHGIGAFAAVDALVAELVRRWPGLHTVTLAGFSAGAQLLQHQAGFAADAPPGVHLRYVIASPGTWLYFDPPAMPTAGAACPQQARWKYGVGDLPVHLDRNAAEAREHYRQADIAYLAGALDSGPGRGSADRLLDHGCAAQLQGPYRLQRAEAYAAYDRQVLMPPRPHGLTVVPGCAHDVGCVLPASEARAALFGEAR